jgi:hypothetical protein
MDQILSDASIAKKALTEEARKIKERTIKEKAGSGPRVIRR